MLLKVLVKICGVANNGQPLLGISYIVEIEDIKSIDADDKIVYDYTHIVMYECYIKEII